MIYALAVIAVLFICFWRFSTTSGFIACLFVIGLALIYRVSHPEPETLSERVGAEIWVDPETQCQYFLNDGLGGTRSPRLNREGKPICGQKDATN